MPETGNTHPFNPIYECHCELTKSGIAMHSIDGRYSYPLSRFGLLTNMTSRQANDRIAQTYTTLRSLIQENAPHISSLIVAKLTPERYCTLSDGEMDILNNALEDVTLKFPQG